jgi:hypothetical protein
MRPLNVTVQLFEKAEVGVSYLSNKVFTPLNPFFPYLKLTGRNSGTPTSPRKGGEKEWKRPLLFSWMRIV